MRVSAKAILILKLPKSYGLTIRFTGPASRTGFVANTCRAGSGATASSGAPQSCRHIVRRSPALDVPVGSHIQERAATDRPLVRSTRRATGSARGSGASHRRTRLSASLTSSRTLGISGAHRP